MLETLLLLGLGSHRLWLLWHQSEIFRAAREWVSGRPGKLGYFANCAMCTATWAGAVMVTAWNIWPLNYLVWAMAATTLLGTVDVFNAYLSRKAMGG